MCPLWSHVCRVLTFLHECFAYLILFPFFFFVASSFRHHGSPSVCSSGSPSPLTLISSFLHLSHLPLILHTPLPLTPTSLTLAYHSARLTSWQGRKGPTRRAPWTSSAWRASSREGQAACWWLTAGRFLSTMHHTYKARSTFAAQSWWRGGCSRTKCLSLSCFNPMAKWRWVKAQLRLPDSWCFLGGRMWLESHSLKCQADIMPSSYLADNGETLDSYLLHNLLLKPLKMVICMFLHFSQINKTKHANCWDLEVPVSGVCHFCSEPN